MIFEKHGDVLKKLKDFVRKDIGAEVIHVEEYTTKCNKIAK